MRSQIFFTSAGLRFSLEVITYQGLRDHFLWRGSFLKIDNVDTSLKKNDIRLMECSKGGKVSRRKEG